MASSSAGSSLWMRTWARATIAPAARRAVAVWVGAGLVAAVLFGPTGMQPADLTRAALGDGAVGAVLLVTWLLLFTPVARALTRPEATAYLRALPGSPRRVGVMIAAAVIGLQLPWLALWVLGEGPAGLLVVVGSGALAVALAQLRPPAARTGWRSWGSGGRALRAAFRRALWRRAGDAILRAAGLAVLAGMAAAAMIRHGEVEGAAAATLGGATVLVISAPGLAGVMLPLLDAHRAMGWLAGSLGLGAATRRAALAATAVGVFVVSGLVAVIAAVGLGGLPVATAAWLAGASVVAHVATALAATAGLVWAARGAAIAARAVVAVIAATAAIVLLLGRFGVVGAAVAMAIGLAAVAMVREEEPA